MDLGILVTPTDVIVHNWYRPLVPIQLVMAEMGKNHSLLILTVQFLMLRYESIRLLICGSNDTLMSKNVDSSYSLRLFDKCPGH
jgi:hypothetical protein